MRAYLALLLAVVACHSDDTNNLPDAPLPGIDASLPIDGSLPSVSVTVTLTGAPQAGVPVYFLNQDSTVVSSTTTDATGTASAMMMAGGSVSVLAPAATVAPSANVYTWEAVRGGDKLKLDLDPPSSATTATITVTIPVDDAAVGYMLYSACADPTTLTTDGNNTVVLTNCGATTDLLVVASDDGGAPVDEIFLPAAAVADTDTVAFAGPYTAIGETTYGYTNVAPDVASVDTTEQLATTAGFLYFGQVTDALATGAATAMQPFPTATGSTDVFVTEFNPGPTAIDALATIEWGPANAAYALDVNTLALPGFATVPAVTATTHKVEWTEDIGGQTPDFAWVTFEVDRDGAAIAHWTWNIMDSHPPNDQITIPTLPTDIFDYNPNETDSTVVDDLLTGKVPGGYDAVRPVIFDIQPEQLITGASGSVSIQELVAPPVTSGIRAVRNPFRLHRGAATPPAKRVRTRW